MLWLIVPSSSRVGTMLQVDHAPCICAGLDPRGPQFSHQLHKHKPINVDGGIAAKGGGGSRDEGQCAPVLFSSV
jgi:hypothetical protein